MSPPRKLRVALLVHYFPPINSSGARRFEALSRLLAADGHDVRVVTTRKSSADGEFTESFPRGVTVCELDALGRARPSTASSGTHEPMYTARPSWKRRFKDLMMASLGQLPDPRLPFALGFAAPWLADEARRALATADVVVATTPPWPPLLAALIARKRFGVPCILDYRDHLSECHEMPGSRLAKALEKRLDRWLVRSADHVVTISPPMAEYYGGMASRVSCIENGFDADLLEAARARVEPPAGDGITIRHMGLVSPGRVPHNILAALVEHHASAPEQCGTLRVEFYGGGALVEEAVASRYPSIRGLFRFLPAVPYARSLELIVAADYLLFSETSSRETLSAQGILTTKLFEYIGSGRPVLADISPATLAGSVLLEVGSHHVVADSPEPFASAMRREEFFTRQPSRVSPESYRYSRQAQARRYAELIARVGEGRGRAARGL